MVVATGGLSWPQLGASDLGHRIAQRFGLKILPTAPALCGLKFPEREMERFKDLSGIHLRVGVSTGKWKMEEDIMITHQGLSGPVMLNGSLYWNEGQEVTVNWIPELTVQSTFERLKKDKVAGVRGEFRNWFSERIPRRLAERIAWNAEARGSWAALPDEKLMALAKDIHAYSFVPSGTFGYRMAEVTRGGVDTREISRETMEAKKVPGLYFIGEVLDVTGQLGGFNFQWAWASGWAAGQSL
jgi:predicted Rossmann fold flavoprotein